MIQNLHHVHRVTIPVLADVKIRQLVDRSLAIEAVTPVAGLLPVCAILAMQTPIASPKSMDTVSVVKAIRVIHGTVDLFAVMPIAITVVDPTSKDATFVPQATR